MRRELRFLSILLFSVFAAEAAEIDLAAANSTCMAVNCAGEAFTRQHGIKINYVCKSSGRLAKGINGRSVGADYYISANRRWMDYMLNHSLVEREDVVSLWGNELVVAVPAGSAIRISSLEQLNSPEVGKILIGDPSTAPFGRYAKQALFNAGIWEQVKGKVETKKHITLLADTLKVAEKNTVGILFATNLNDSISRVYTVGENLHQPISYYSAVLAGSKGRKEVLLLSEFLQGKEAQSCFSAQGFQVK